MKYCFAIFLALASIGAMFKLPVIVNQPPKPIYLVWDAPTNCDVASYILRYGKSIDLLSDYQVLGLVTNTQVSAGSGPWFALFAVGTNDELSDPAYLKWPSNYDTVIYVWHRVLLDCVTNPIDSTRFWTGLDATITRAQYISPIQ